MRIERETKFRQVIKKRQPNLTIILENVHDPHNIGAVLRTCDSVGVKEIFVLYSEPRLNREHLYLGEASSSGARKWIDVWFYTDVVACFEHVKRDYEQIWSTHLATNSKSLHDLDLSASMALLFGNEHSGVSKDALAYSDGNFIIPQVGMVQSLNISVACAVTLYEAFRQRSLKGFYSDNLQMNAAQQAALFEEYEKRHTYKIKNRSVKKMK